MLVRLGYRDKLVEVRNGIVYLFDGRLWSAPLESVVEYHLRGQGVVPDPIRKVAGDLYRIILGENLVRETSADSGERYGETAAG